MNDVEPSGGGPAGASSPTDTGSVSVQIPQPHEISDNEKQDAMGAYLMMFAAMGIGLPLPIVNLIAATIYYFVNRKSSPFVAFHSFQSLLSQVPVTLLNFAVLFSFVRIVVNELTFERGFYVLLATMILANLVYLIVSIVALTRARKGRFFYMPVFGRVAFSFHYVRTEREKAPATNRPPSGM